jgi:hypothetical protein
MRQEVLARLYQLRQGQGQFMSCHGFFRVGVEPATTHGTIGWVTDYGAKRTGGKKALSTAGIGLDHGYLALQGIAKDILTGHSDQ